MITVKLPTRSVLEYLGVALPIGFALWAFGLPLLAVLGHYTEGAVWVAATSAAGLAAFVMYLIPAPILGRATIMLLAVGVVFAAITGWGSTASYVVLGGLPGYVVGYLARVGMLSCLAQREAVVAANRADQAEADGGVAAAHQGADSGEASSFTNDQVLDEIAEAVLADGRDAMRKQYADPDSPGSRLRRMIADAKAEGRAERGDEPAQ